MADSVVLWHGLFNFTQKIKILCVGFYRVVLRSALAGLVSTNFIVMPDMRTLPVNNLDNMSQKLRLETM